MNMKLKPLLLSCVLATCATMPATLFAGEPGQPTATARVEARELTAEAFEALKIGNFDRTAELIERARSRADDPTLAQVADWIDAFETQRAEFRAERQKAYEEQVADVNLLLAEQKPDYAIDAAARAFSYAEDKDAFHAEAWVQDLIAEVTELAAGFEADEQWLKALRVYSDLSGIEPQNGQWRQKLKDTTRRLRLLNVYAPDHLKEMRDEEIAAADKVRILLDPEAEPTTRPTDMQPEELTFRLDWHDKLDGIKGDMLKEALADALSHYHTDVSMRKMLGGGLRAVEALTTTTGLEAAFPTLENLDDRAAFVLGLGRLQEIVERSGAPDRRLINDVLDELRRLNSRTLRIQEEAIISEFADGAFGELDDFTAMIWPYDLAEFEKSTQGEFMGVGIQIRNSDAGFLEVVSPLEDSPAYRAGIKPGSIITAIDGKSAKGITTNDAVRFITGPRGTPVTLTIQEPEGDEKDYTLTRERIRVQSIKGWMHLPGGGWEYLLDEEQKIAYIRLTSFTRETADELRQALDGVTTGGVRGVILDLRYNPGGLLQSATEVADAFLDGGKIVSTRSQRRPQDESSMLARADRNDLKVPVVVLVNQFSASASEIVSGALKDQARAVVVGERTFGKGSVQMLFPLDRRQAYLKLTTSHYYLPSGRSIHKDEGDTEWGVDPHLKIEMTPEQMTNALKARQELDILRFEALEPGTENFEEAREQLLANDPQLSAAMLLLRLQLAGEQVVAQR